MSIYQKNPPDIDQLFAEGTLLDQALVESVRNALKEHKRAGNPIVVWRDGMVVLVQPEDIPV